MPDSARSQRISPITSKAVPSKVPTHRLAGRFLAAVVAGGLVGGLTPPAAQALEVLPEPKLVSFSLDRQVTTLVTLSDTVGEALEEHSIAVEATDEVSPALTSEVAAGDTVEVVYAKRLRLKDGAKKARTISVPAVTAGEALREAGVRLTRHDRVTPREGVRVSEGATVAVKRIRYKRLVKPKALPFKTVTKKAPRMYEGTRKVAKAGKKGKQRLIFKRKFVNGEVASTKRVKTKLVRKPQKRVVLVGTKKRPAAQLSGVWRSLAQCESGGNPRIVSSNGLYHGLFQFSVGTWHSVGGGGLPSQASPAEQLKRAKILQARSGWGQWPHCSSVLGLR